ncbi:aminodeoxychorismate lyase [Falsibacillus albus]|uniref:4-amino-4-deoxychorismate lyase n=1 Tax=Falsibacillus albus TaxID=2478915 RepID=A0A3L7JLP6_9BACI|nr:aminodeoxychorismate lyase [Falsibacillus albus]RLQ91666.1 4-amino-4-deoxychorismate lyase [Falsibacillus albus]
MYIFLNGKMVLKEQAEISPFDHGYLYGIGAFETFRTYDGHPFLFDDHLSRLEDALKQLNIDMIPEKSVLLEQIRRLSIANELPDSYLRINVSAGIGEIGLQTTPYSNPTTIIFQKKLPSTLQQLQEKKGKLLKVKRNTPETAERLKSHHYLNNIVAKREIADQPLTEGIFLNEHDYVAEGITSNIFWIKNQTLYTPAIETGILKGITRQYILTIAPLLNLKSEEGFYSKEALLDADEVFFTNSIQEAIPVNDIAGIEFPGKNGGFFRKIHQQYRMHSGSLWGRSEIFDNGGQQ